MNTIFAFLSGIILSISGLLGIQKSMNTPSVVLSSEATDSAEVVTATVAGEIATLTPTPIPETPTPTIDKEQAKKDYDSCIKSCENTIIDYRKITPAQDKSLSTIQQLQQELVEKQNSCKNECKTKFGQ